MKLEFRLRQNHSGVSACGIILSCRFAWRNVVSRCFILLFTVNAEAHFMSLRAIYKSLLCELAVFGVLFVDIIIILTFPPHHPSFFPLLSLL